MPILREGGGTPIEFRNPQPQVITTPSGADLTMAVSSQAQTFTGVQTFTSPVITGGTITGASLVNPVVTGTTPVSITASTVTIGAATHANRPVVLNRATGIAGTLPLATGTGNHYEFWVGTTFTGAATIVTGQVTDVMAGNAIIHDTDDATVHGFSTTNATTLTLYGASNATGGIIGAKVILVDLATNLWGVEYQSNGAASPSTPFS